MHNIVIISSSVRTGRKSHRVALFLKNYISENKIGNAEIIDLNACQFPLFDERLRYMKDPAADVLDFAEKIKAADGVIVVTPEYNGGYPASIKNVIDLLVEEWKRKTVALATVSGGAFAGTQAGSSLPFIFLKIGATVVPAAFRVAAVQKAYHEDGTPVDAVTTHHHAQIFLNEFSWYLEASRRMKAE